MLIKILGNTKKNQNRKENNPAQFTSRFKHPSMPHSIFLDARTQKHIYTFMNKMWTENTKQRYEAYKIHKTLPYDQIVDNYTVEETPFNQIWPAKIISATCACRHRANLLSSQIWWLLRSSLLRPDEVVLAVQVGESRWQNCSLIHTILDGGHIAHHLLRIKTFPLCANELEVAR